MKNPERVIKSISFKNLNFSYTKSDVVLDDVTLDLPTNSVVEVRGWQGSGRSTILKILSGLTPPSSGSYLLNNEKVEEMSFEQFIKYRLKIGFSFDYGGLINNKTIRENLELPLMYHNQYTFEEVEQQVDEIIEDFCLKRDAGKRPSAISGGMRKAAVVARSFLLNPEFLILDDPTTGLNSYIREHLRDKIKYSREQGLIPHIYICSDDREFLDGLVDSELVIENKKLYVRTVESKSSKGAAV